MIYRKSSPKTPGVGVGVGVGLNFRAVWKHGVIFKKFRLGPTIFLPKTFPRIIRVVRLVTIHT